VADEAGRKAAGQSGATRRRPGLSRAAVLDAALEIVDSAGIGGLSMRKLGASLHVEAMALYRYVRNREALLDGLVDRVMDELYADPATLLRPEDDWRDFLQRVAAGVRRIARQHPQLFPLVATRPPAAPWIRPPLRSLRWVEGFLSGLQERGFTEDGAIYAYRAFATFLVGHLLLEVSARGVDPVPVAVTDEPPPDVDLSAYPVLRRLAPRLAVEDLDEEFAHSLENLLDRIGDNSRLARPGARG